MHEHPCGPSHGMGMKSLEIAWINHCANSSWLSSSIHRSISPDGGVLGAISSGPSGMAKGNLSLPIGIPWYTGGNLSFSFHLMASPTPLTDAPSLVAFKQIIQHGTVGDLKKLLAASTSVAAKRQCLRWAVEADADDMADEILRSHTGSLVSHALLMTAAKSGRHRVLPALMARTDPRAHASAALHQAIKLKQWSTAAVLCPVSDVNTHRESSLAEVARNKGPDTLAQLLLECGASPINLLNGWHQTIMGDHVSMARLLMPNVDVKQNQSNALYKAISFKYKELAQLLLPSSDPQAVFDSKIGTGKAGAPEPQWGDLDLLASLVSHELRQTWIHRHPGKLPLAERVMQAHDRQAAAGELPHSSSRRRAPN